MKNKGIDFRTSPFFPEMTRFVSVLFIPVGAFLISISLFGGAVVILGCIMILTTTYRLEIDREKKTYKDYVWFLGLKNGKSQRFEKIEYIFIKKGKMSQTMNSRVSSSVLTKEVFDGYLRFSESEKIHLLTMENKTKLVNTLKRMANSLEVKIIDYSEEEPVVIN